MAVTKSQLIDRIALRANIPRKRAEKVVNCVFETMADSLIEGSRIEMRGFGSFAVKKYPSYMGRNPRTNEPVFVPEKRAIKFKVGKKLRERINQDK